MLFNHEPNDEIFIFGYSRGAYTARSFAGFLRHVGILDADNAQKIKDAIKLYKDAMGERGDDHSDALHFRATNSKKICVSEHDRDWRCQNIEGFNQTDSAILNIKYVGVWDTVGALGWPNLLPFAGWLNRKRGFHDISLTSKVHSARHALAIDERRKLFRPTIWNNINELNADRKFSSYDPDAPYQQKWFPGVHGSVGGGGPERGLSDSAFSWILGGAKRAGLQINVGQNARIYDVKPDPLSPIQNQPKRPFHEKYIIGWLNFTFFHGDREGPQDIKDVSAFAIRRWNTKANDLPEYKSYRPKTLMYLKDDLNKLSKELSDHDGSKLQLKSHNSHLVLQGDDLPKISKKYYKNIKRVDDIYDLNRDLIDDPTEIHIGWKIRIPPV